MAGDRARGGLSSEIAERVDAIALDCRGLARVDFFLGSGPDGDDLLVINEVNTMPGFTPISMDPKMWAASGLSYPQLVDELVQLAIERHGRRRRRTDR